VAGRSAGRLGVLGGLALIVLSGCGSPPDTVPFEPAELSFLSITLGTSARLESPPAADLAQVSSIAHTARRGVVQIRAKQEFAASSYLGKLGLMSLELVLDPSIGKVLVWPFYLSFGWIGEFFVEQQGTGFVVAISDQRAYVLTNSHVVGREPTQIVIRTLGASLGGDGEGVLAELLWWDDELDVALLRADLSGVDASQLAALPLGSADRDLLGELCLAVGYPGRGESDDEVPSFSTVTLGLVSSQEVVVPFLARPGTVASGPRGILQTDAAINPGNSGGPLLDLEGQVIGINTIKIIGPDADNLGFAIPIDWVREALLRELEAAGE
jgi:S1-C subfamily serine protease